MSVEMEIEQAVYVQLTYITCSQRHCPFVWRLEVFLLHLISVSMCRLRRLTIMLLRMIFWLATKLARARVHTIVKAVMDSLCVVDYGLSV